MKMIIVLNKKIKHCYKYDEPCCGCSDSQIILGQLAVDEISGHNVTLESDGLKKDGFMCDRCLNEAKKDCAAYLIVDPNGLL